MGAGWAKTGFDSVDEAANEYTNNPSDEVRDYWTPVGSTKRIVLIDDIPFCFWNHSLYELTKQAGDNEICLKRNHIEKTCPLCEADMWSSFMGYLTVVDCGEVVRQGADVSLMGYQGKNALYQFDKKKMPLKKGGKDKPGMLQKLRTFKDRKGGSLVGTVWDVTRHGKKEESVGADWEYVGRIDLSSSDALKQALVDMEGSPLDSVDDPMIEDLTTEPAPYDELFQPKSIAQLAKLLPGGGQAQLAQQAEESSGSYGDADDDIPF